MIKILVNHLRELGWDITLLACSTGAPTVDDRLRYASMRAVDKILSNKAVVALRTSSSIGLDMFRILFAPEHYLHGVVQDGKVLMTCHKHSHPTSGLESAEFDLNDPKSIPQIETAIYNFSQRPIVWTLLP